MFLLLWRLEDLLSDLIHQQPIEAEVAHGFQKGVEIHRLHHVAAGKVRRRSRCPGPLCEQVTITTGTIRVRSSALIAPSTWTVSRTRGLDLTGFFRQGTWREHTGEGSGQCRQQIPGPS